MSYPADGGLHGYDRIRAPKSRMPYLVRLIKPNPISYLTTGTFNLIVKDP